MLLEGIGMNQGKPSIDVIAVGDLMFHGAIRQAMEQGADPAWPLREIIERWQDADVRFGNLETPISRLGKPAADASDLYRAAPGLGGGLRSAGFNVLHLANSHIYDYGEEGVQATVNELYQAKILPLGMGRSEQEAANPAIVNREGFRVAFLGYTTCHNILNRAHTLVACSADLDRMAKDVERLKPSVDAVIISCHTGTMGNPYPAPETRRMARAVLESGAVAFLAHHPHIPQGAELIAQGVAYYSLGDFVTPSLDKSRRHTYWVRLRLERHRLVEHRIEPCLVGVDHVTRLAPPETRERILARYQELCAALVDDSSDRLHFEFAGRSLSRYLAGWYYELKENGIRSLFHKIGSLRPYHWELVCRALQARLRSLLRRRASSASLTRHD